MSPSTRYELRALPVEITADDACLSGDLTCPTAARGVVLFAHGSGSSRKSPRNRAVAATLEEAGFATLLLDLLTPEEDAREQAGALLRFDVDRLATRLVAAMEWLARDPATGRLPLGIFGASTGSAAALIAAALRPARVEAIVSRGGRPDLADRSLRGVLAPTLLVVGGADLQVLEFNRRAAGRLACTHELAVVAGATHLFEEPGALEQVARLARNWFERYLVEHPALAAPRTGGLGAQGLERSRTDPEC